MITRQTIRNLKAVVIACSVMSVIMPSPITYWNWWKEKDEEERRIMVLWMIGSMLFVLLIYVYFSKMRGIENA